MKQLRSLSSDRPLGAQTTPFPLALLELASQQRSHISRSSLSCASHGQDPCIPHNQHLPVLQRERGTVETKNRGAGRGRQTEGETERGGTEWRKSDREPGRGRQTGRDRTISEKRSQRQLIASPNATSPAASTTANTDRVDDALGTSGVSNSSAELNPSNWRKINPLACTTGVVDPAVERHRPVDRSE